VDDDDVTYTRILGPLDELSPAGATVRRSQPALVWRPKLGDEQVFELTTRIVRIGRHDENEIMLAGPTVSARHATVRREAIGAVIEDEGSLNGTFVNGLRIETHLLEDGDHVQVGPHLLVFVGADAGGATPST
jgi:pSer/pThr/pTyr-binding forkhead associated (FHA) protein